MNANEQARRLRDAACELTRVVEIVDTITRRTNAFSSSEFDQATLLARESTLGALGHAYEQLAELAVRQAEEERRESEVSR